MAVSTYEHGVTWRDVPTSIVAPITADSGIPVVVGAAPIFLSDDPAPINVPRIYYTYEEAVAEMGFSMAFHRYPLCAAMFEYFVLFNTGPIILSNMADPAQFAGTPVVDESHTFVTSTITLGPDIPKTGVIVKDSTGTTTYVLDRDYTLSYDINSQLAITRIPSTVGGTIPEAPNTVVKVSYTPVDYSTITKDMIIGGADPVTGKGTGLQVVQDVFPKLAIVPGIILTPGWSQDPEVAAVCASIGDNINGCFRCVSYVDIDSTVVLKPQDVYQWKQNNNYVSNRLYDCWPRVGIDEKDFWLSVEAAALTEWVDNNNGNTPVESPSNKNLKMTKTLAGPLTAPIEISFGKGYADMLNGQGIATAINWIGGWKLWGNNLSIYPSSSDPKDRWLPVRRMTDWLGNTIVLTVYQFVDKPGNRRLIDSVVDSLNIWLNSLVSAQQALGARVEFRQDENATTDLLNGHYKFHVYEAFPTPAEWIEFLIEFDVRYLSTLFTPTTQGGLAAT